MGFWQQLESRFFLNADAIGVEPLRPLDLAPCEQVIQVDLDRQNELPGREYPHVMLAHLASAEESQGTIAAQDLGQDPEQAAIDSFPALPVLSDPVPEDDAPSEAIVGPIECPDRR